MKVFFSKSKKAVLLLCMVMLLVFGAACGGQDENGGNGQNQTPGTSSNQTISLDKAKELALKDAGINSSEVTFVKEELEKDKQVPSYELEFYNDSAEYEYDVHAGTGEILESSVEYIAAKSQNGRTAGQNVITLDQAKEIALKHCGAAAADVTFTETKLDQEENVYEIEFYKGEAGYEYEINAAGGDIRGVCKRLKAHM
ncbi:MAG: PepSY domain-containing protein [Firmicutes bacterium]|nr:PepSY domain-containing protein [Bacillota bacterium]